MGDVGLGRSPHSENLKGNRSQESSSVLPDRPSKQQSRDLGAPSLEGGTALTTHPTPRNKKLRKGSG